MVADSSSPDPKALWRDQAPEADPVSLERVHGLVRSYDRKMQASAAIIAVMLVIIGLLGGQLWAKAHDALMRAWAILFVVGELSVCALGYRVAFPPRDAAEPAGAYLRRRLQIRLDNLKGRWLLMAAPLAPFMLLSFYVAVTNRRGPLWARVLPHIVFLAFLALVALRQRARIPKIRAQLQELDELLGH